MKDRKYCLVLRTHDFADIVAQSDDFDALVELKDRYMDGDVCETADVRAWELEQFHKMQSEK